MGFLGSPSSCSLIAIILVLNMVVVCHGGKTSAFVRKVEKTVDMPLNSDVFQVPPGYNAPQQVLISNFLFHKLFLHGFFGGVRIDRELGV